MDDGGRVGRAVPPESRARVEEGVELFGAGGDAWLCNKCGNFGLMSGVEVG